MGEGDKGVIGLWTFSTGDEESLKDGRSEESFSLGFFRSRDK